MENYQFVAQLRESDMVREKDLGNNISSFNFTRKCFQNAAWDNLTTKARGLFVDTESNKIVARSFDKFFAVGERPETQMSALKESLVFPIKGYLKENGFLGIVSCDNNGELFVSSKSQNYGEFADIFKNVLEKYNTDIMREICDNFDVSLVFEVIDPINDPHIVEYNDTHLVLLEAICNDYEYTHKRDEWTKIIADLCGVPYKQHRYTFDNWSEFEENYPLLLEQTGVEGYVFEDKNGFMFKLKTNWYKQWKSIRSAINRVANGKAIECRYECSKELVRFIEWFVPFYMDTYEGEIPSVITVRNEWERYCAI